MMAAGKNIVVPSVNEENSEQNWMKNDPLSIISSLFGYKIRKYIYIIHIWLTAALCFIQTFNLIYLREICMNKNMNSLGPYACLIIIQQGMNMTVIPLLKYHNDIFDTQEMVAKYSWSINVGGKKLQQKILYDSILAKFLGLGLCLMSIVVTLLFIPYIGDENDIYFIKMYISAHLGSWNRTFFFIACIFHFTITYASLVFLLANSYFIFHIKAQFSLLTYYVNQTSEIQEDDDLVHEILVTCLKQHVILKRIFSSVANAANLPLLCMSFFGINGLAAAIYFIIMDISPPSNFRIILLASAFIAYLIIQCKFGNLLIEESEKLHKNIYNLPWVSWNEINKKLLLMFILQTSEPLKISCYGLFVLNNELILKVTKMVYSLTALALNFH